MEIVTGGIDGGGGVIAIPLEISNGVSDVVLVKTWVTIFECY